MKEILSSFGSEFLRPLLTLFLPGALGCAPMAFVSCRGFEDLREYAAANHAEAIGAIAFISMFLGIFFESLGSRVENCWDSIAGEEHGKNWYFYLRQAVDKEPVGHRYLREKRVQSAVREIVRAKAVESCHDLSTVVLHLKFELGSSVASVSAIPTITLCPGSPWIRLGLLAAAG